jgi:hypothetical protein
MRLTDIDRDTVISRLPKALRAMMKVAPLYVGGGFIRSTIAGEKASDIDVFGPSKEVLQIHATALAQETKARIHKTDNAWTLFGRGKPVQFIYRWVFDGPIGVIDSFDFTVCQAVVWWNPVGGPTGEGAWDSSAEEAFYPDLAARRLVYTYPVRIEEAGGSLLRVRKFLKRGYNIRIDSLAGVVARLHSSIDDFGAEILSYNEGVEREQAVAKVITGLLREVDPLIDIDEHKEGHNDAV